MAKERNAVRAGIFILISVVAAVVIILAIAGVSEFTTHYEHRRIVFSLQDDVGGLRQGDDVRLGGMRVGSVSDIHFAAKGSQGENNPPDNEIQVEIRIPSTYRIATDAKIGVETTLTGVTCLNISDLGSGQPLAENQSLQGMPAALSQLFTTIAADSPLVGQDLAAVHQTLETYRRVGEDAHGIVRDVHDRFDAVSDRANTALDDVHNWLGPSTGDFHSSMANVADVTGQVKKDLPPLVAKVTDTIDHANDSIKRASGMLDDIKATVTNVKAATSTARAIIVGNQSRLGEIVSDLHHTSENLDAASVEIRSSPWRLLYKPGPNELANLNLYDAARQFAQGASDLNDAASALHDASKDPDIPPGQVQKLYNALLDRFEHFRQVENDLWLKVRN